MRSNRLELTVRYEPMRPWRKSQPRQSWNQSWSTSTWLDSCCTLRQFTQFGERSPQWVNSLCWTVTQLESGMSTPADQRVPRAVTVRSRRRMFREADTWSSASPVTGVTLSGPTVTYLVDSSLRLWTRAARPRIRNLPPKAPETTSGSA